MPVTKTYSMPRGDTRSLPLKVPKDTYSEGATIYFALKKAVDNVLTDSSAVFKTEIVDDDIVEVTDTSVNYLFQVFKENTNLVNPDIYRAEFQFVSADKKVVLTFPDPSIMLLYWEITGDINRRTS